MIKVVASSSLPFLSRIVTIEGKPYLDGGIADSIPFKQAINDGYKKIVVVLTRDENYRKKPFKFKKILQWKYGKYPLFVEAMLKRAEKYNKTLEEIRTAEERGEIFVIRPSKELKIGRLEKDKEKIKALHSLGFSKATQKKDSLLNYLFSNIPNK